MHVTDNFTIQFFENDPANPPAQSLDQPRDLPSFIVSIAVGNPNRTGACCVFDYSASIAPLALQPNIIYWVSIFNDASDEQSTPVWAWGSQSSTNNAEITALRNQSPIWGSQSGLKMDFQLLGDVSEPSEVPEPSSVLLIATGLTGFLLRHQSKGQGRGRIPDGRNS